MTIFIYANNVDTTLAGAISASATSLTLSSAANLPVSIPSGSAFVITLNDRATGQNFEIIYATAVSGATLSGLQRAQEGTAAQSWLANDYAYSAPTAGEMNGFGQLGAVNTWTGNNTFSNPIAVGAATAPGQAITKGQAESEFALLAGSASQVFNVANAVSNTQAIPLGQLPGLFPGNLTASGYKKYPDATSPSGYFIEQWGTVQTTNGIFVAFPIAFPNICLNVEITESASGSATWGSGNPTVHGSSGKSTTGFTHWTLSWNGAGGWSNGSNTCDWRAIGY